MEKNTVTIATLVDVYLDSYRDPFLHSLTARGEFIPQFRTLNSEPQDLNPKPKTQALIPKQKRPHEHD